QASPTDPCAESHSDGRHLSRWAFCLTPHLLSSSRFPGRQRTSWRRCRRRPQSRAKEMHAYQPPRVGSSPSYARRSSSSKLFEHAVRAAPLDRIHERVDVSASLGAEVDVIGVLVHIERQNRNAACECVAVVGGPLIDQPPVVRRPRQQDPAGTTT